MVLVKQEYRKVGGPNYVSSSMQKKSEFGNIQSRQVAEDYIASIMYPGSGQGVKIPDFNLYPTVTAHTEQEGTFSCSAAGNGGMLVRLHAGTGPGPTSGGGGAITLQNPATTTDLAFTYLADTNVRSNPAAFAASYAFCRLVSASLEVQYVGNDNNNSGRIVQGILVKNEYLAATYVSFNSILQSRDNLCCAVTGGAFMRYRPVDESSFDFVDVTSTAAAENQGAFICAVNACGAGAPFRWKLSCNWECIIRSDAYDQPIANLAAMSPSDPQAFNQAKQTVGAIPAANLLTNDQITKNDNSGEKATSAASSLLDKVVGVATTVAESYGGVPALMAKGIKLLRGPSKISKRNFVLRTSAPKRSSRTSQKALASSKPRWKN